MEIGKAIKKLRRDKNMTQEKLADYLDISPQAISRWENGLAMPELSLVPVIATLFGVTTDCLFGLDENDVDNAVKAIISRSDDAENDADMNKAALLILKDGISRFPNNWVLKNAFLGKSYSTYVHYKSVLDSSFLSDAIQYAEDILDNCTEDGIRYSAIETLASIYAVCGDKEKAVATILKMPENSAVRDKLLTVMLDGEEKIRKIKENVLNYADMLSLSLRTLAFSGIYESDEKLTLLKKIERIYDVILESESDRKTEVMCNVNRYMASVYADIGDAENTLKYLNREADILLELDRGIEVEPSLVRDENNNGGKLKKQNRDAYYLADELSYRSEHKRYDFVRDTESFLRFTEKLDTILGGAE